MADKMKVLPGKAFYTYSDEEVVWLHDADHTPHNKRHADSDLKVQFRAPIFQGAVPHISVEVIETTTTKDSGKPVTRSKEIWFTMTPAHFDAIAAHVNRAKPAVASVDLLKNALKLIDAMMPGVANIALQDYAALNDVPLALRAAIAAAEGDTK